MEKVDRLGWTEGFSFLAYGALFGIRTNDAEILEPLKELVMSLEWSLSDESVVDSLVSVRVGPPARRGRKNYHLLYWGAGRLMRTLDLNEIMEFFQERFKGIAQQFSPNDLFIPGAVVSHNDRHLVLPAQVDSGLNELLEALEGRGASCLTRNVFGISDSGGLKGENGHDLVDAKNVLVVFTEHSKRNKTLRGRAISPGNAALLLLGSGVGVASRAQKALSTVAAFSQRVESLKGKRGEAQQAADYLLKKLSS